ncbi:MAG: LppX_LprAFG lipoprotein [Gaiellaceae bacterium]
MRRALALLLLVLPLAACGGSDVTSLDPIAQAASNTRDAAGAHFAMNARLALQGQNVAFGGPGEIADHGRKLHMQLTMPMAVLGVSGSSGASATFEAVSAGGFFYLRGGVFERIAPGKWIRVKNTDKNFNLGQNDPSQMLQYLRATSDIDEQGQDTVRGVSTTHYAARIQIDKVAERVSADAARALRQLSTSLRTKEIPMDVWVDDDGLVRRVKMDWRSPSGGSFVVNMDLFDFGDVDIDVPAKSDTTDLSTMLGGG